MKTLQSSRAGRECPARSVARDPAAWGWLLVALIALLPLGEALAEHHQAEGAKAAPREAPVADVTGSRAMQGEQAEGGEAAVRASPAPAGTPVKTDSR